MRTADLRAHTAHLHDLADLAPTWQHRTELLDVAKEYDRLADIAAANESHRVGTVGRA